jgi:serine/threonine protein kinase
MDMDGHIVLTDFGLSKDKVEDITENSLQTFCGTVEYMAPELVKGQKYSVAVDWWSYGVLVYEMMCTRTPFFHQKGRKAIFQGIIKSEPQYPMHFSAPSQDFIGKLLAKEVCKHQIDSKLSRMTCKPYFYNAYNYLFALGKCSFGDGKEWSAGYSAASMV